jgi:germination protein M
MMDFRYKMPKVIRCLLLLIAVVLLAVGCTDNKPAVPPAGQTPEKKTEMMTLTLYFATKDASALVAEKREIAKNDHPVRTAVEELIAGPKNADLVKLIPSTTRVKDIRIKDHVAYVDFSEAFVKDQGGGSAGEILTVSAVINTLTEFPEVKRVQFMVEGKNLETLNGHLDLSEPLLRNEAIIKK